MQSLNRPNDWGCGRLSNTLRADQRRPPQLYSLDRWGRLNRIGAGSPFPRLLGRICNTPCRLRAPSTAGSPGSISRRARMFAAHDGLAGGAGSCSAAGGNACGWIRKRDGWCVALGWDGGAYFQSEFVRPLGEGAATSARPLLGGRSVSGSRDHSKREDVAHCRSHAVLTAERLGLCSTL